MKVKSLILALGVFISIPGFASATGSTTPDTKGGQAEKAPCDCHDGKVHHGMHRDWQAKMAEREQKLLTLVDQYTPGKKAEWTKVLAEKKALHQKWHSPEFAKQHEQWKKEKLAKMQELKKQYDEGKLTKEEFFKKVHGDKEFGHWKTYHDLKAAVDAKDKKKVEENLNLLLSHYKQHNQMMKEKMKK
ncbi:hypothetical protein NDK43_12940 [Neobacillus pocheonensis]|uniref:YHYH domain-containing protein n=1 Tax=Neobacillus pocheonensis TaxID=363869 RepID=A0ABT0W9X8_9BACI|nr:hypothetical protein [Neobacillus pocheonensis]